MPLALIVGAGIGGLSSAIALRKAGWDVRIFERAPMPRDVGFGVGLAPNAISALRELGVADAVVSQGVTPLSVEVCRLDGRVIRRLQARPEAIAPANRLVVVFRPALHRALIGGLDGTPLEVNRGVVAVDADGARVRVVLSDGDTVTGDIVVGADGVASTIRAFLHPSEPPARPSGYVAVRGLSRALDELEGLQGLWHFGPGIESGVVQASRDAIYWFLSLFSEDVRQAPEDVDRVIRAVLPRCNPRLRAIIEGSAPSDVRIDELFVRDPLPAWGAGPVTLLGDAAHPVLPHTGQGAALALQDAVALGRALTNSADSVAALRAYESTRIPDANRLIRMGPRLARLTTTKSGLIGAVRNTAIRLIPESVIAAAFTNGGALRAQKTNM